MNLYEIEKWIWTEQDFEQMGWHDCPIYAMKFDDQVVFDFIPDQSLRRDSDHQPKILS